MQEYKNIHCEEKRIKESSRIMNKYPDRIPIIVCRADGCQIEMIDKQKFLVPKDMTIGQFIYIIRKRINLKPDEALFVLVNNTLQPSSVTISEVYETQADKDGFLYVVYSSENTFG